MNAAIFDMKTGYWITQGLQSSARCDEAIRTARNIARERKKSVIVEDYGTGECYRITPGGYRWRAPRGWIISGDENEA
jgi:hypothetical protein